MRATESEKGRKKGVFFVNGRGFRECFVQDLFCTVQDSLTFVLYLCAIKKMGGEQCWVGTDFNLVWC